MQQNQLCSVLLFGTRIVLLDNSALYFLLALLAKPIQFDFHIYPVGCEKVPDSDRYKTDSNLWRNPTFPVNRYTPTHARSAPLELFLQSLAKELLCVMQQNQLFSVLQFGTRIVLLDRLALYLLLAKPIQFENPHLSYGMWQGARLRPIQNR